MTDISPAIFHQYDIRGIYGDDLTESSALLIGQALGTFIQEKGVIKIAVGRDNRVSGESIAKNFIAGLVQTGCSVTYFNYVLNPHIYFAWHHLDFNAGAVVTASHNPAQYNGFKFSLKKKPLLGDDYQDILKICQSGKFKQAKGSLEKGNIWPDYKANILKSVRLSRKLKVAVDCGNGTAGMFAPEILKEMGCAVLPIYCESDGRFPNHTPYPQKVEYYSKLREAIVADHLDAGLTLDGDGDRLGIYDEKGNYIEADRLAMIFVKDICKNNANKKIAMNVSTSLSLIDFVESVGGEFFFTKTGYPYVTMKMTEVEAIFGGEISGHFFFMDKFYGFDDALYAGLRLLEILAETNKTLSEITAEMPKYFETREFRIEIPNQIDKLEVISKFRDEIIKEYPTVKILDIDGIRFSFPESWGLIRPSNTEPLLTGRAEAKTAEGRESIKNIIKDKLSKYGIDLDWEKYK